jgi:hypothetical protein
VIIFIESELVSILSTDTNFDSDTDNIDTGIDASGILDYPDNYAGHGILQ